MIRLAKPDIDDADIRAVTEVLKSGYLVQGTYVSELEQKVAEYVGVRYASAVNSCTSALHLSLCAINTAPDDLVIVPAYSYIATANIVRLCGAHPVFVDITPDTFAIDPNRLSEILEQLMSNSVVAQRVKAVIPVHAFGQPADITDIITISSRYSIPVIEDAACALGASYDNQKAGSFGFIGCFSLHPRKAITTGEGGIIVTNDEKYIGSIRALRNHGIDPDSPKTDFILPGFNYRMTDIQGALGVTQMKKLDRIIADRREKASYYDILLSNTPIRKPFVNPLCFHVYQSYVVLLHHCDAKKRDMIISVMKDRGIETTIGTYNMPSTKYYRTRYDFKPGDFPVVDDIAARSMTLPLHGELTGETQEFIIRTLQELS